MFSKVVVKPLIDFWEDMNWVTCDNGSMFKIFDLVRKSYDLGVNCCSCSLNLLEKHCALIESWSGEID